MQSKNGTQRIHAEIRRYVSKRRSSYPVSVADLVRRIRYAAPEIGLDDRELAELVAAEIIQSGGNVAFDTHCGAKPNEN